MSTQEYVDSLNIDQLEYLVSAAKEKLQSIRAGERQEYIVLCDSWCNRSFFNRNDIEGCLKAFEKELREQFAKGCFEELTLQVARDYEHEMPILEKFS